MLMLRERELRNPLANVYPLTQELSIAADAEALTVLNAIQQHATAALSGKHARAVEMPQVARTNLVLSTQPRWSQSALL